METKTSFILFLFLLIFFVVPYTSASNVEGKEKIRKLSLTCTVVNEGSLKTSENKIDVNKRSKGETLAFFSGTTDAGDFKNYLKFVCQQPLRSTILNIQLFVESGQVEVPPQPSLLYQLIRSDEDLVNKAEVFFSSVISASQPPPTSAPGNPKPTPSARSGGKKNNPLNTDIPIPIPKLNFGDLELDIGINATSVTQNLNQQAHSMPINLKLEAPNLPMTLELSGENLPMNLHIEKFETTMINWSVWIVLTVFLIFAFVLLIIQHYKVRMLKKQVKALSRAKGDPLAQSPVFSENVSDN